VSLAATSLALAAAVLHAGWNALVKGGNDPLLSMWAIIVVGAAAVLPLWAWYDPPGLRMLTLLGASVALHVAYDVSMARAYRVTDLSVAYPVTRGSAAVLSAVGGALLLGDVLSPGMLVGVVMAAAGLCVLAATRSDLRAFRIALAAAVLLAGFTLIDGGLARELGSSLQLAAWLFPAHAGAQTVLVLVVRPRQEIWRFLVTHRRDVLLTGLAAPLSYLATLAAIERAPVGPVLALRETSMIFATVLAVVVLGEVVSRRRWLAVASIAAAAIVITLG
jgi:drug/metabolite transporter (DMT)-like permease